MVVEGYTDVLAAHQAEIDEAVAVMGTAITPEQLQQLSGHAEEAVLALDADRAGRAAMLRAQRVAGSRKLRLRVAAMPAGEDPADMLGGRGGGAGARADRRRRCELPEFHVRLALDEADLSSPAGRDRALDEVVPVLAAMGESISRDELARVVADRLDADPELVTRRVSGEARRGATRPAGAAHTGRWERGRGRAGRAAAAAERARAARAGAAGDVHRLPDGGAGAPGAADAGAPVVAGGGAGAGIGWRGISTSR